MFIEQRRGLKNAPGIRTALAFLHDVVVSAAAWWFAFLLRFNFAVPVEFSGLMVSALPWVVTFQAGLFWYMGLYRGIWRYASIPDLKRIFMAATLAGLAITAAFLMLRVTSPIPRAVLVLDPLLLVVMMGGSRIAYRAWKEQRLYGLATVQGEPVLLLGAGEAGLALLKEMERSVQWRVVGVLDDRVALHGAYLQGVRILGGLSGLAHVARELSVKTVILAIPSANAQQRREMLRQSESAGLRLLTVPSVEDIASGKVSVSQVRSVDIEDLLGRDSVVLDEVGLHHLLQDKVVMVTGAGGSIGSELCRQIVRFQPRLLLMLELSEFALYQIDKELAENTPQMKRVAIMADVRNEVRIMQIINEYRPSVVFHAAAYKHVPLMEHENAAEALLNNTLGTHVLAQACKLSGVEKFVLISTDKAVNPTNVMGASKRLAEMVCQGLQAKMGTQFIMVRFGNVLGSSGSVIPRFHEQIAKGGPVTVTHPEITRYFMSIPEATQLVMQAGHMGQGGEIFVLDMGEPVRIADLARDMIRLSGFQDGEIEIIYTGLRPGEKLYEELLADDEHTLSTPHAKLRIARARNIDERWLENLVEWLSTVRELDEYRLKSELSGWVEEYRQPIHDLARPPTSVTIH